MLVSEAIGAALAGLGADTVFGVVGSGNFHVTNALVAHGARFVAARHENGAACMADGWARLAGRPGILSVHQGPGLTNAITGITEAAKSRTPMLVLAADVAAAAVRSNFRIDVASLATAVGATPERLHSPQTAVGGRDPGLRHGGPGAADRGAGPAAGRAGRPCDGPGWPRARRRGAGDDRGQRDRGHGDRGRRAAAGDGGAAGRGAGPGPAAGVHRRAGRPARPGRGPGPRWPGSRRAAGRCWPRRPRPRGCSAAARGTWT